MRKDRELKSQKFTRRVFIVTMVQWLVFFIFACRMFFLQIIKGKDYKTLSDKNSINVIFIEPERGKILDCKGLELATNQTCYRLVLYKQKNSKTKLLVEKLASVLNWDQQTSDEIYAKIKAAPYLRPTTLLDYVSWKDVCEFEENSNEIKDAYISTGARREYKYGELFAHVIGYMGTANKNEIAALDLKLHKDLKVGKTGVEKVFEQDLLGSFGMKKVEVNAYRVVVREISEQPSKPGSNLQLSINHSLQQYAYNQLGDKAGSVIAMDVNNGKILAMVSTPSFDPNHFSQGISETNWQDLINNKDLPLTNKAITKLYPPGSTFKMATALAMLQYGIDPEQKIFCNGATEIHGRVFKCWKNDGHGHVNFHQAIAGSCNCYFYVMGLNTGIDNIYAMATKLGIGQKTGITLPGEASGIAPCKQWKKKQHNQSWFAGDTVNATVGQGYVLTTPIQIATMTARIASGKYIKPQLINESKNSYDILDINPDHLIKVRNGLKDVFNSPQGTGYNNRIENFDFAIAGKTGTAQVISQDTATNQGAFVKHHRSHSIFTGYAPAHNPKYSCTVIVDNGGWGSANAAPIARNVLLFAQETL